MEAVDARAIRCKTHPPVRRRSASRPEAPAGGTGQEIVIPLPIELDGTPRGECESIFYVGDNRFGALRRVGILRLSDRFHGMREKVSPDRFVQKHPCFVLRGILTGSDGGVGALSIAANICGRNQAT